MHISKKLFCRLDTTSIPIPAAIPIDCITSNIDQYTGTCIIYNNNYSCTNNQFIISYDETMMILSSMDTANDHESPN